MSSSEDVRVAQLRDKLTGGAPPVPRLTKEQAAIIGVYTGVLCGDFADAQEYIEKLMGRPVWTHEMGSKAFAAELTNLARSDFLSICNVKE